MSEDNYYTIEYRLALEDGSTTSYTVEIDEETMISRIAPTTEPFPDWTRLEHEQCSQCPLQGSSHCPIAIRLIEPILRFNGLVSHVSAMTTVITPERSYVKEGDVQDALRSLFGLIMATSGCPQMQPFRFMARYHLPFSTLEETIYRITCTYLLRQLLAGLDRNEISVDLQEIERLYNIMQSLNKHMADRLKTAVKWKGDGTLNAIVILSTFSSLIPVIIRDELKKLQPLFD